MRASPPRLNSTRQSFTSHDFTETQLLYFIRQVILRMLTADFLVFSTILAAAWCNSITVLGPKTLNATSGSCLLIPCRFEISTENEKYLNLSPEVTWRRGSLWSHYNKNSFTDAHRQMEPLIKVVGDLREKNCTTVMMNLTSQHSDRYYLKFSSEGFSVTATKAVPIGVSDSLAEPYVIVPGLREGEVGNLTCTVSAPCPSNPPNVTWDHALGGNITQWTQLNADGTHNVSAILNFVPSLHHNELKVNCVSIHLLDRQDKPLLSHKTVILNVEYPPKETQISFTGSVWIGNNVTLTCQSNANPPAVHKWFMKTEGKVEEVGVSRVLSFTATHNKSGEYICEAQNLHGAANSTILQINVPGISFTAFLAVLALFSLLLFALLIVLIYTRYRCKKTHKSETNQDEDIYANVSSSATEKHQSNTYEIKESCTVNPECTFKNLSCEDIYANC